jgi:hypothetical protein
MTRSGLGWHKMATIYFCWDKGGEAQTAEHGNRHIHHCCSCVAAHYLLPCSSRLGSAQFSWQPSSAGVGKP